MNRRLTLIVVDDQQSAIDHALTVIKLFIDVNVQATFTDSVAALKYLRKNHVDFVLLDIEMPAVDGLAFALQMPPEIKIIFCTGHRKYAVDAFTHEAVDYLLKPIQSERFAKAINRMKDALMIAADGTTPIKHDYYYFMIKGPIKFHRTKIDFDEIVYIESRGDYTYFFLISELRNENKRRLEVQRKHQHQIETGKTVEKKDHGTAYKGMPTLLTLQRVNEIVTGSTLMQIHKSYILNTSYLRGYAARTIELVDLKAIALPTGSRRNYPEFFDLIDNHRGPNT